MGSGRSVRTPEKRSAFLAGLRATGLVTSAAKAAKIGKVSAYEWRADDAEFRKEWDAIIQEITLPLLETHALKRAVEGSDLLVMFLMKAHKREKYGDQAKVTGAGDGGALKVTFEIEPPHDSTKS